MNLQVPPDAPPLAHAAAAALLVLHISGGTIGMASGAVSMVARKGGAAHRAAGRVFLVSMLAMAGVGASVAPFLPSQQWTNTLAGVMTLYLVVTGWIAGRRGQGEAGRAEVAGLAMALAGLSAAGLGLWLNALAARPEHGPTEMGLYVFGLIGLFAVAGDANLILRKGLVGPARLARHLWRMNTALTIALGSFFLGQPRFLPAAIRDTFIPAIPVLAALAGLAFWLVKVRLKPRRQPLKPSLATRTAPKAS